MPPPPRHAGADAAVAGVEEDRQLRLGEDFVERVGEAVVGKELLERRMQLQAAHAAGRDEPPGVGHAPAPARRIDADERDRDVGVLGREGEDVSLVRWGRPVSRSSTVKTTHAIWRER